MKVPLLAAAAALVLGACSSPAGPGTLARSEEASTLPPITLAPLATTSTIPTTTTTTTVSVTGVEIDPTEDAASPEPNLDIIVASLTGLLGPTDDLYTDAASIASFPPLTSTPPDAEIIEISVGAGTPTDDGFVLAQIALSVSTTLDSGAAFEQMAAALRGVGMSPVDTSGDAQNRSAAFRLPDGDQFDEVVLTATANGPGAIVRVASNRSIPTSQLDPFLNWADSPLPFPSSDRQRMLVVARSSGEGRLRTVRVTVESAVLVDGTSAQREANRLVERVNDSTEFDTINPSEEDQPLSGPLGFARLDTLTYEIVPTAREEVTPDGEIELVDALEIRLLGSLEPAR